MKRILFFLTLLLTLSGFLITGTMTANAKTAANQPTEKEFRIERSMPKEAVSNLG